MSLHPFLRSSSRSGGQRAPGLTSAGEIHLALRDDIISMRRLPGDAVSEKEIALHQGVSRTPVREALLRLAEEGLVEISPRSGTRVARIPVAVLPDAMFARAAIERELARLAALRAPGSAITEIRAQIERQREAMIAGSELRFHEADEAFHQAISAAVGLPGVTDIVARIKSQLDRYRRLTLPQPGRIERVIIEHTAIVDAIAARDGEAAAAAMGRHLEGLQASLIATRDHNPDYFTGDVADIGVGLEALLAR
jgi:DNA-binding GntR family transcriptional regulator